MYYQFILGFFFLVSTLKVFCASSISVGYFDRNLYSNTDRYIEGLKMEKSPYERGISLMYQGSIAGALMIDIKGGGNYGYWKEEERLIQTASSFLAAEMPIISLFGIRLFIEGSIFGPTYLTESFAHDRSVVRKVVYQQFVGLGFSIRNLAFHVRTFQYTSTKDLFLHPTFQTPLLLFMGFSF